MTTPPEQARALADACEEMGLNSSAHVIRSLTGQVEKLTAVPQEVMEALDRMCTPLHASRLAGTTAEADARSMEIIRNHVLAAPQPPQPERAPMKRLRKPKLKNGELRVYWGKLPHDAPDVIFSWQGDSSMKRDTALLCYHFYSKMEPSLLEELKRRGYDITTMEFSIMKLVSPTQAA